MEFFTRVNAFRLRSHLDKYLSAYDDQKSVGQSRNMHSQKTIWKVDYVDQENNVIIVKSCYGKFLSISNDPFLLGMTGKKIVQIEPQYACAQNIAWEPIRDGFQVRLKTFHGNFLRANGCTFPWRNSVTHDVPLACSTQKWILWCVEPVYEEFSAYKSPMFSESSLRPCCNEFEIRSPPTHKLMKGDGIVDQAGSTESSNLFSYKLSCDDSLESTPKKIEGRTIFYQIADESEDVHEETTNANCMIFNGNEVEELTRKLEEETEMDGLIVCCRSPLNGQLFPMKLQLPPCCASMHVVIVSPSSKLARGLSEKKPKEYDMDGAPDDAFCSEIQT